MAELKTVAVLGAGVMGSGIAAHLAGAGFPVLLLDIVPREAGGDRNLLARAGKENALKAKPAAFFTPRDADLITVGNLEDDLARAAKCDWVVEVVKEELEVKRALFARLEPLLGEATIVSSNTSGLPIAQLTEGRSAKFKEHFLVTHFFNPVRYMKLLELVAGPETAPAIVEKMAHIGEELLGKGIVFAKDTPNFIANRIGVFAMLYVIEVATQQPGYTIEEVDAVFGPALGRPKSAVFRTADMVGLDTIIHVADNCYANLPNDERRQVFLPPPVLKEMVARRLLGDKSGGGFMKKTPAGIVTLDWKSLEYRPQEKARFASIGAAKGMSDVGEKVRTVLAGDDRGAALARQVIFATLAYASHRIGEIADDIVNVDRALRWGFAWELGPFETWDAIGVEAGLKAMGELGIAPAEWVKKMVAAGRKSFYSEGSYWDVKGGSARPVPLPARQLRLPLGRKGGAVLFENDGATLYDLGDRIACLALHTKMNALDDDVIAAVHKSVDIAEARCDGLVIGNEDARAFSAGANVFLVLMAANQGSWKAIEELIVSTQQAFLRLRYARVPTVSAPFGLALGGGAELTMGAAATRASAELYMGLVEAGVGLIPAGGGCKELLGRHLEALPDDADPFPFIKKVFMQVALGKVSTSAEEARAMGMLGLADGVTLNRDFLLHDAKEVALGLARAGYRPPRPRSVRLPGPSGYATFRSTLQMMREAHQISDHDVLVGSKLAWVLTGGRTAPSLRVHEEQLLDLEREAFLQLCGEEKTRERMQYMLMNNKPLRN